MAQANDGTSDEMTDPRVMGCMRGDCYSSGTRLGGYSVLVAETGRGVYSSIFLSGGKDEWDTRKPAGNGFIGP